MRPDGQRAELRIRELDTVKAFLELGGELAQLGITRVREAADALALGEMERVYRLLGQSAAFTEAANRINALAKSFG